MPEPAVSSRYTGVAVGLHWLIAALIIGMLAIGKWMTELDVESPLRFSLTQWHKSFGITILLLSLFRLYWRRTHKPPPSMLDGPAWEEKAADLTHRIFYILLVAVPLSGWLLVSSSPLNIPTVLFNTLPWPHLPLPATEKVAGIFHLLHELTANFLLVLLLLHVGAALRHHLILKDNTLSRMSPIAESGKLASGLIPLAVIIVALVAAIFTMNKLTSKTVPVAITAGQVRFTATLMGSDLVGNFDTTEVEVQLDPSNAHTGMLNATVQTNSLHTGDSQADGTLVDTDWFDVANFPEARFISTGMTGQPDGSIEITGMLTIKDTSREIKFPVNIEQLDGTQLLKGSFTINRLDYKIGAVDQPTEGYAGFNVMIEFSFEID